jgi:Predicted permease
VRAALLCLLIVRPFGNVIAWSVVLAIVCSPLHQRLLRKTGRVSLSALAASLLVVFAFVVPLALIAGVAITQEWGSRIRCPRDAQAVMGSSHSLTFTLSLWRFLGFGSTRSCHPNWPSDNGGTIQLSS